VVLFGPHGRRYRHPTREALRAYRGVCGISSVQITFFEDRPQHTHVMPPGGFRLAIINSFDLDEALALRETMARGFGLEAHAERSRSPIGAPARARDTRSACV